MIDRSKLPNKRMGKKKKEEREEKPNIGMKEIMIDLVNISHVLMCNACPVKPFCKTRKRCSNEFPYLVRIDMLSKKYPEKLGDASFIAEEIMKISDEDIKKYMDEKNNKKDVGPTVPKEELPSGPEEDPPK